MLQTELPSYIIRSIFKAKGNSPFIIGRHLVWESYNFKSCIHIFKASWMIMPNVKLSGITQANHWIFMSSLKIYQINVKVKIFVTIHYMILKSLSTQNTNWLQINIHTKMYKRRSWHKCVSLYSQAHQFSHSVCRDL